MWRPAPPCVLAVVLLALVVSSSSTLQCPNQQYLTDPGSIGDLPPLVSSVVVTEPFLVNYPPEELFAFSSPFDGFCWCSATKTVPQNITINFTEPLVIHVLLFGGYAVDPATAYVRAFSLEYSEADNSDLIVDHLPKVFIVSGPEVVLFQLPQPILAKTLHFQIHDYFSNSFITNGAPCWTLALTGCTFNESKEEQPASVAPSPTPSPQESSNGAVGIAVSTAVGTVVAVAVLVGVGVILCWAISNGYIFSHPKSNIQRHTKIIERENTLTRFENELYTLSDSGRESQQIREPTSSGRGLLPSDDLTDTAPVTTPTITESLTQSVVYETVVPVGDGGQVKAGSLVDNPAYLGTKGQGLCSAGYEPVLPQPNDSTP